METADWIEIGRIVAAQGLKGEVRVYPSSDFPERFLEPGRRWLRRLNAPQPQPVDLVRGRWLEGKGLYVVQLEGISDRTQAETLRGATLLVPASERPTLAADEFYVADLIGLRVLLQANGQEIGRVSDFFEAGNDLLEVTLTAPAGEPGEGQNISTPRRVLVPFVPAIVPTVDLTQGVIYVDPPRGLLEA
ncbi:MAG TPA: ribosome maturation factor RimM [Leptolyngbyaceae cyanobacterium M65_K2018_010]|nr:ribosome maturation factor RimM [Leptolyngbyaceae cyanobacterium M65_K2018_010]